MQKTQAGITKNNLWRPITSCDYCNNMPSGTPMGNTPPHTHTPTLSTFYENFGDLYWKIPLGLYTHIFKIVSPAIWNKSSSKFSISIETSLKKYNDEWSNRSIQASRMIINDETKILLFICFVFIKLRVNYNDGHFF